MIDEALLEAAAAVFDNRAAALRQMGALPRAELVVTFAQIRAGITAADLNEWLRQAGAVDMREPSIYRMTVGTDDGAAAIRNAFAAYRPPQGTNLTRDNNVGNSRCVYVGGSLRVSSRLHQHLQSTNSPGTYALKMGLWCPDVENSVTMEVASLRGVAASQVQDIEDALWRSSRPMFGKMGPK